MNRTLITICICLISQITFSQLVGLVTDKDQKPLSTVNIYLENTFVGTTSNDEGFYELNVTQPNTYTIVFKYLGFKTEKRTIDIVSFPFEINVIMQVEEFTLDEVVINSTENPANRIIRQAIANRNIMLDKIKEYTAKFYSRGLIRIKNAPEKILGQDIGDLGGGLDSTRSGIIYLSETISDIEYKQPDQLKETITASKVSGDNSGFSFNTAMDVDYNFYNNTIELGNQIVSPIADYAFNYYQYKLEGMFYDEKGNLINMIKVIPKRENDRVFAGTIYIVEDQWSIYAIELDITGQQAQLPAADIITLKQTFSYSESDRFWVLISQNIDFVYSIFGIKGDGRFTAVFSDYNFNPKFTTTTFSREILSFKEDANKLDSTYWQSNRPVPLTAEERTDYTKKDSIQIVRKSKTYLDSVDTKGNRFKLINILTGYNHKNTYEEKYWSISGPLSGINFNTIQGYHNMVSLNFRKNYDEFRKYIQANASVGYGIDDERLRATATLTYKFNNITRPFITLTGGVRLQQFNDQEPISSFVNSISTLFFEDNYLKAYDRSFAEISYNQEWFNGFNVSVSTSYERRSPLFNTTNYVTINEENDDYTSNNPLDETAFGISPFESHHIIKLNVTTRLRFGQKYFSYPNSRFRIPNEDYPSLYINYESGLAATVDQYNYDQISIRLAQGFNIANKGEFQYNIKAGKFFNAGAIAFMDFQHFNGNQTRIGSTFGSYLNVFNNLPYYSLSTNKSYFEAHIEHDFKGFILNKIPLLNKLNYNLVLGMHALATENNAPYFEFTIGIDNIGLKKFSFLRLDYLRSYQNGFKNDAVIFGLKFLDIID